MIIRRLDQCPVFVSGDGAQLRELLHADKGDFGFRYSLAHAVVKPGVRTKPHRLKTSEVYYILKGTGRMFVGAFSRMVKAGDAVVIPEHALQSIKNTGRSALEFLCIVDPAWRVEDEEILDSREKSS